MREDYTSWRGLNASDQNNVDLGRAEGVLDDAAGGSWLVVRLRSGKQGSVAIPMDHVRLERSRLRIAYEEQTVLRAPRLKAAVKKLPRVDVLRLDLHYHHELPKKLTPLDMAEAYGKGKIDRDSLIKELAAWPYAPAVEPDSSLESPDAFDDPPVWEKGTIHDLEIAVDRGFITTETYGDILEEMRRLRIRP
ncbi:MULTISPECIES: hypothetical protein [unclassified Streptomyces]|uniref:hypothetical protein n=1 Tax=unclassified Streptomyces TaxID=2593676 RepID=UPI003D72CAA3